MRFDLQSASSDAFYDFPYPADIRLKADGTPEVANFPNPQDKPMLAGLVKIAGEHPGWPTVPVAYFHFDAPIAAQELEHVNPADTSSNILLVDIDPDSPDRGKLVPTIAKIPATDIYVPDNLLAVASFPGVVLNSNRSYAFVIMRGLGDASGEPLGSPLEFEQVKLGRDPGGAEGLAAQYEPLWETLKTIGVDKREVAAATVFTTGDVVQETYDLSQRLLEKYDVELENLEVDPDDGADHDRFCEIVGTVDFPQFQQGTPPFNEDGLFDFGADGLPVEQRKETAKIVITLPKQPMPEGGYPLVMYFHGSGGIAGQVVDRGRVTEPGGEPTKGEGPAYVLAPHGFATVGSSHPLSPDRVPGAGEIAYLNFNNLAATRDTFRQGVVEQRLYLEALTKLQISPDLVASCSGLSLPSGEAAYHFATKPILAMGQSMGGMYTNMIGAVEPRIEAVVPTGAGASGATSSRRPRSSAISRTWQASFWGPRSRSTTCTQPCRSSRRPGKPSSPWSTRPGSPGGTWKVTRCARCTNQWARATATFPRRFITHSAWPTVTRKPGRQSGRRCRLPSRSGASMASRTIR